MGFSQKLDFPCFCCKHFQKTEMRYPKETHSLANPSFGFTLVLAYRKRKQDRAIRWLLMQRIWISRQFFALIAEQNYKNTLQKNRPHLHYVFPTTFWNLVNVAFLHFLKVRQVVQKCGKLKIKSNLDNVSRRKIAEKTQNCSWLAIFSAGSTRFSQRLKKLIEPFTGLHCGKKRRTLNF